MQLTDLLTVASPVRLRYVIKRQSYGFGKQSILQLQQVLYFSNQNISVKVAVK